MKKTRLLLMLTVLIGSNGCAEPIARESKDLRYYFVEENPNKMLDVGPLKPIDEKTVLLFPVVTHGMIDGKRVAYGMGSPVLYKPGDDLDGVRFERIERWPIRRYMVWARGYYMTGIPRSFLEIYKIDGRSCLLVRLTPIKPGTDTNAMEKAIINEFRKGKIVIEAPLQIADGIDYARLITSSELTSWRQSVNTGYRAGMVIWGATDENVDILLTQDDYKLIESYLRGEAEVSPKKTLNSEGKQSVTNSP